MKELIERDAAIDALIERDPNCGIDSAEVIKDLPSAEPRIIRCKDCREYRRYIDTDITFCDLTEAEVKECDFCSRAVKMMEVENEC